MFFPFFFFFFLQSLVSGDVTGDEYLFQRGSLCLIKRTLGSKQTQLLFNEQGSGIRSVAVDPEQAKAFSLSVETARVVARTVEKIEEAYRNKFGYRFIGKRKKKTDFPFF